MVVIVVVILLNVVEVIVESMHRRCMRDARYADAHGSPSLPQG